MCGICGVISFRQGKVEAKKLRMMMNEMPHRGPDDDGTFISGNIGFGFVRLSIQDLSMAGHQPMQDESARFTIVFNGEIYNYLEIRKDLIKRGHKFRSDTDTEVLLKAFIEWGQECVNYFNGMFAFAIYDKKEKRTFIARDRFGIKPFYYYRDENYFIFASEISPILKVLDANKVSANYQSIFDYLVSNRTDLNRSTFFDNIYKLQHAHCINIADGAFSIRKWYDLSDNLNKPFSSVDEYRNLFSSSVALRLRSDVPVGVCLSGGLDSSSIVSVLLKDYNKGDLNTFSAVYGAGKRCDESKYIDLFEDQLSNMYYTTPSSDLLFADLDTFIRAHTEPVSSTSAYAQFKVMELAKKHVKVTLDGQGADEQLGGYHYFFGNYFKELLNQLKLIKLYSEGYHYINHHRSLYAIKTFLFYLLPRTLKTSIRVKQKGYIDSEFADAWSTDSNITDQLYKSVNLNKALINHFEYKLEHLLKWEDRNAMWFSVESRVPFLDHRLVEKTLSMPTHKIINKGYTKYLLREAMKKTLPEEIRMRQDKIGFATPEDKWFREEKYRGFILDLIYSKKFGERAIFDVEEIKNLYHQHLTDTKNISGDIWKWINLELWFQKFIDS